MQGRFRRIQHLLNTLPVLEATVRLGSFTKAGEHLGLSQPTVSRHISNLEEHLGGALFIRNHNKLSVTNLGRELAKATDLGLSHIDALVRKTMQEATAEGITLACTQSFANCWLLPRFSRLQQATGDMQMHLRTSYWLDDIDPDSVDMIIHWRPQGWVGRPRMRLFDEVAFPVCSPDYLSRNPALRDCAENPSQLTQFNLLHYEERAGEFVMWSDWFAEFRSSFRPPDGAYRFANYQFMLQAAADGQGVALAWQHLTADKLSSGDLVSVGPEIRRKGAGYFLEYRDGGETRQYQKEVLDWFENEAKQ